MQCVESLRAQAYFDGEVDAVAAADIERHMEGCGECRALVRELETTRTALRRDLQHLRAPPALRARVAAALDRESGAHAPRRRAWQRSIAGVRPFWAGAISGIGASAVAAGLAFLFLAPLLANPLVDDLVGAHMRSLMPTHLIDVESTDKHTVKPWFAGHADVSPAVADFTQQGYRLIGGRVDYLAHQRSAVVVYQHGAHVINVFSWSANKSPLPQSATRSGYHLIFWRAGDLEYCAVADTGWEELRALVRLLEELNARERAQ